MNLFKLPAFLSKVMNSVKQKFSALPFVNKQRGAEQIESRRGEQKLFTNSSGQPADGPPSRTSRIPWPGRRAAAARWKSR